MNFRYIAVHSGRNICTQGLLYVRNGDVSRFYTTNDFFEDFFFSNLIFLGFEKNSGSVPRNACVACETKLCVTTIRKCDYRTDTQTDTQTDGQTDAGQSDPYVLLCFAGVTIIILIIAA